MGRARNEMSVKNKYYISKHRYLELKHFCLQYPEWKRALNLIEKYPPSKSIVQVNSDSSDGYFFEKTMLQRVELERRMELVEKTCLATDNYLGVFIFRCVTEGVSYTELHVKDGMACCKDMFYDRYHKFFWLLDQAR